MTAVTGPLSDSARKATGEVLQGALVDLLDLLLIAKQAHWNILGPRFRSIHLQLDEVVATARSYADTIAERASTIGVPPDGRAATLAQYSGLAQPPDGWLQESAVVELLIDVLGETVRRMRERITLTGDTDLVSQDVLLGLTAQLEKHHWMFQAERPMSR
ncbi:DNA starvation/stationary phase protection protein [Streptomyces sp. TRM66268-LWL]|uniref:DNA starvation/stationary phase protection protein n=1 Tax=Streptomyces polyasparticus TaxID=2767826 RepID=A0ABR7SHJ2_9ACTN|nr:DNA starvation/stationary phase protection protein [Streptomyces polyasparticus]MBC9713951.1 DNA starvation/stationary phase protection protein [Streptomyces polyasparticus]